MVNFGSVGDELKTLESLQFKFVTIEAATNKFSKENEIGKGGFGVVYKVNYSDFVSNPKFLYKIFSRDINKTISIIAGCSF